MDKRKAIQKIFGVVQKKAQEELSALLGHSLEFGAPEISESQRDTLFEPLEQAQVLARMDVEGEHAGEAYLLTSLSDALSLGGALIMLPEDEIAERISSGEFGPDEGDAFGEIVNICAGVLTKLFQDLYSDKLRFVKRDQERIDPVAISLKGEYPVPEGTLWVSRYALTLEGKPLAGPCHIVVPEALLGISPQEAPAVADAPPEPAGASEEQAQPTEATPEEKVVAANPAHAANGDAAPRAEPVPDAPAAAPPAAPDGVIEEKALLKIFKTINAKIGEDVGSFLGQDVKLTPVSSGLTRRSELFDGLELRQVLSNCRVEGDRAGTSYLLTDLRAAVTLGGTLIMLPESELETRIEGNEFAAEDSDAFGEIVNIIAGIYTSVFHEVYPGNLRFIKNEQTVIDPLAVSAKEDYPFEPDELYSNRCEISMDGVRLGAMEMVIPAELILVKQPTAVAQKAQPETKPAAEKPQAPVDPATVKPLVLVFADEEQRAAEFVAALQQLELVARYCSLQADSREAVNSGGLRGAVLVMGDVGEQGIAAAIRIRSAIPQRLPLIAAGPNWTKSLVLRAIKYGVQDILVTPASEGLIQEKIRAHYAPC